MTKRIPCIHHPRLTHTITLISASILASIWLQACSSGSSGSSSGNSGGGNGQQFAYIADRIGVVQCPLDSNGINQANCQKIDMTGISQYRGGGGLAINNGFAYFADMGYNSYTQCQVGDAGLQYNTCTLTILMGIINTPFNVAVANNFAYFTDSAPNELTQCSITATGINSASCVKLTPGSGGALNTPSGIAVNDNYAYILNMSNNSYTQCPLSANGLDASNCSTHTPNGNLTLNSPYGITINNNKVYIVNNGNDSITQCAINTNVIDQNSCTAITPQGAAALDKPLAIAINRGIAYITNVAGLDPNTAQGFMTQCVVNANGIDSASCVKLTFTGSTTLKWPAGIAIYPQ
jgi:hypothetical protein